MTTLDNGSILLLGTLWVTSFRHTPRYPEAREEWGINTFCPLIEVNSSCEEDINSLVFLTHGTGGIWVSGGWGKLLSKEMQKLALERWGGKSGRWRSERWQFLSHHGGFSLLPALLTVCDNGLHWWCVFEHSSHKITADRGEAYFPTKAAV